MKRIFSVFSTVLFSSSLFAAHVPADFYGHWLQKNYAESLRMPLIYTPNATEFDYITEFIFSKELSDETMVAFNDTEGTSFPLEIKGNQLLVEIAPDEVYTLNVVKDNGQKLLICRSQKTGAKLDFLFIEGEELAFNSSQKWMQNLITGNYAATIEMGMRVRGEMTSSIWMNSDGTLVGVEKYDRYEIIHNPLELADFPLVKLYNSRNPKKTELMGYEWKADKRVIFYQLKKNKDTEDYTYRKGEIYLQLEKK